MKIEAGCSYPCCVCRDALIEIPEDADPETLTMMNAGFERALARGVPEEECGLLCAKCSEGLLAAGGKVRIGGILED